MTDLEIYPRTGKEVRLARIARNVGHDDRLNLAVILRDWCKANHKDPNTHEIRARNPRTNTWNRVSID